MPPFDVIVVGKGNAALCAALAARDDTGARVVMLEAAPVDESGGMMRFAFNSVEDLKLLADIPDEESEIARYASLVRKSGMRPD